MVITDIDDKIIKRSLEVRCQLVYTRLKYEYKITPGYLTRR